jgi:hypothetical protein
MTIAWARVSKDNKVWKESIVPRRSHTILWLDSTAGFDNICMHLATVALLIEFLSACGKQFIAMNGSIQNNTYGFGKALSFKLYYVTGTIINEQRVLIARNVFMLWTLEIPTMYKDDFFVACQLLDTIENHATGCEPEGVLLIWVPAAGS